MAWRELWGSNPLRRGEEPRVHPYTKLLLRTVQLWWPLCMMTAAMLDTAWLGSMDLVLGEIDR